MSEMNNNRIKVSAGALILAALIYYTADFGTLACVAVPVLIHELGHIVCLRLLGLRICGFKAELRGLCMGYAGCTSGFGRILAAAAGPAAGGLYALIASYAGKIYGSDWLLCSAGVSVILTAFNLLPALPLDGGQIFAELAAAAFGGRRGMRLAELTGAVADVDGQGSGGAGRVDMAAAVAAGESRAWAEKRTAVNQIIIYCR